MALQFTAIYGGLLGLWVVFLTVMVIRFRRGNNVSLGAGGDEMGERLIRAHGNAAETVPLFLVLMALVEFNGGEVIVLHIMGMVFCVGRLLHGIHFMALRRSGRLRVYGMLFTIIALVVASMETIRLGFGL